MCSVEMYSFPERDPIQYMYTLSDHILNIKKSHTYLGVAFDNAMSWSPKC